MTTHTQQTLVIGANGKSGKRIVSKLEQRGFNVRRGSRVGSPAFDWEDASTWNSACAGCDSAYLVYPQDLPMDLATKRICSFVDQAKIAGIQRIVLLTGRGEDDAYVQEQYVKKSGLNWTVIRSAWFNQNFTEGEFSEMFDRGRLALSSGHVPEPFVDLDDLAEVACIALTEPGHHQQVYEVTGPRLITLAEVTKELSLAQGYWIDFVNLTHKEFLDQLVESGVSKQYRTQLDYLFGTLLDGRNGRIGDGVQRALGREPRDFAEFALQFAKSRQTMSADGQVTIRKANEQVVRRFITEFINDGNESVLEELLHDDYLYRSPNDEIHGRSNLCEMFRGLRSAFPDMKVEIQDLICSPDSTTTTMAFHGTHAGEFMDIPATGKKVVIRGIIISKFHNAQIKEEFEILDSLSLLQQIGVA